MGVEPVASLVVSGVVDRALQHFGRKVFTRWADYRARSFVNEFVSTVAGFSSERADSSKVEEQLAQIVEDDVKSAALYDAFRYVFLSASRKIGPRVIGLHMAEAVAGLIDDDEISDAVMLAASALLDREFADFLSYTAAHGVTDSAFRESSEETAVIKTEPVDFDSSWRGGRQHSGPIDLRLEIGSWAQKLAQIGLVVQDISEEEISYEEDSERHIDEPGTIRRIHRSIELREGVSHLVRLSRIAMRAGDDAG